MGLEPTPLGLKDRCSTSWAKSRIKSILYHIEHRIRFELTSGEWRSPYAFHYTNDATFLLWREQMESNHHQVVNSHPLDLRAIFPSILSDSLARLCFLFPMQRYAGAPQSICVAEKNQKKVCFFFTSLWKREIRGTPKAFLLKMTLLRISKLIGQWAQCEWNNVFLKKAERIQ